MAKTTTSSTPSETPKQSKKTAPAKDQKTETNAVLPNRIETLTLSWVELAPEYQKATDAAARRVKLPGFRKGKVPTAMATPYLDQNELIQRTLDKVLSAAYTKLVNDKKIQPLTTPEVSPVKVEPGQDWVLEVEIAEQPTINTKNYQTITKKALTAAQKEAADQPEQKEATNKLTPEAKENAKKDQLLKHVFTALVTELKPQVPELLIRREAGYELRQLSQSLEQVGLNLEQYLTKRNLTAEQLTSEVAATSLARLQLELLLQAISREIKIDVTDQDINAEIEKSGHAGHDHTQDPEYRRYLATVLVRQRTIDHLLSL